MAIHRGRTPQRRQAERRRQLIEAAFDTIAESGVGALRVRAVSERARLNDRYFYESFPDCRELLLATFDDQFQLSIAGIMATLAGSPPDLSARTRAVVEFTLGFIGEDPRRERLLVELQHAEALAGRRLQLIETLTETVAVQVRALLGAAAGSDEQVRLSALTLVGGLLELTTQWYQGQIHVRRTDLIEFITAMVVRTCAGAGTLTPPAAPGPAG